MRICLVSPSFYPAKFYGGPIFSTWDLSRYLARKGYKIYVSTTNANGVNRLDDVPYNLYTNIYENIFVKYYNEQIIGYFSLSFLVGIFRDIKKADLIYIQYIFTYTSIIALFYSFLLRKKVVLHPRGSLSSWGMLYKRRWLKLFWINFLVRPFIRDVIWQSSSALESKDITSYFNSACIVKISDGVDFDSFQDSTKISYIDLMRKYTKHEFSFVSNVILSIGRLHKIKGFDLLIDSFSMYLAKNPDAKLLIAGSDDGFSKSLQNQIIDLDLTDSVFLIGFINHQEKVELLSNCSIFALSSYFESFGIVVVEALACGSPVLVSDKTSWKDLERNKCGILAVNHKDHLCNAMDLLIKRNYNPQDCKMYVRANFDWSYITDNFIKLVIKNVYFRD